MLSAAIQITATVGLAGFAGWICYLIGHMNGWRDRGRLEIQIKVFTEPNILLSGLPLEERRGEEKSKTPLPPYTFRKL